MPADWFISFWCQRSIYHSAGTWEVLGFPPSLKVVDLLIGTRVSPEEEMQGLDLAQHGERGYVYEY